MSAHRDASVEPVCLGADDRLHNSGPGRGHEQYRMPAIGTRFTLDYMKLLNCWPGASAEDARALGAVQPRHQRIPGRLVARYAWTMVRALGASAGAASERDPLRALAALGQVVGERGLVDGIVVTARPNDLYKVRSSRPQVVELLDAYPPSDEAAAVVLTTVASCSPPLVLWGREPSLRMLRPDKALLVARLRRGEASSDAERVWSEVQALCARCAA